MESLMPNAIGLSGHATPESNDGKEGARPQRALGRAAGGEASPRLVTRGESDNTRPNAIIHWLSFTVDKSCFPQAVVRPGLPNRLKHVMAACAPGFKLYGGSDGES